jgi:hypothetical protein
MLGSRVVVQFGFPEGSAGTDLWETEDMQKKVKGRVAKRAARKVKREEGTITESTNSVNQRHNMEEGKSPYAKRKPREDVNQAAARVVHKLTDNK